MTNTVLWLSPDAQQQQSGNNQVIAAYLIDPTTNKAYAVSGGGGGGGAVTDVVATGNITAAQTAQGTAVANATVVLALGTGQATWEAQIIGLGSGSTVAFDGVDDASTSTNWQAAVGYNASIINPIPITSIAGPGPFIIRGTSGGYQQVRVRCTVYNGTDTIVVRLIGSVGALSGIGGVVSNDGTFAKESGGNLASAKANLDTIVTNTTGVATAANQSTGNTSLSSIATNTTGLATQATLAAVKSDLDSIIINTTGLGTQTTLASILTALQGILSTQVADLSTTGTISAAQPVIGTPVSNATVVLTVGNGQSTWKAQLLAGGGGFTSGTTIVADKSVDGGTTWYSASFKVSGASPATTVSSVVGPGPVEMTGDCAGVNRVRIRCSGLNSTETVAVSLRASAGISDIGLISSIPAGSNNIGSVNVANANTNGQATMANSAPVVVASDQSKLPTKASSGDFVAGSIADLAHGQATMANSVPVVVASDQSNVPGNTKQLNGTTISVGSGTSDNGTQRVVNAGAATGTKSNVASSASSVTILTSNTARKGAMVYNDSTQILYLDLSGGTASNSSYSVQVPSQSFFELPGPIIYNGAITGIWAAANGNARVTEFS